MDSRIIVHNHVTQNTNDKKELSPSLAQLEALPESIGKVKKAAVDSGYDSQNNKEETEEQKQRRELYNRRKSTNRVSFWDFKIPSLDLLDFH